MPGKDFLALLEEVGFRRVTLNKYTGFKSSAYTEGALFFGQKVIGGKEQEAPQVQAEPIPDPGTEAQCAPKPGFT